MLMSSLCRANFFLVSWLRFISYSAFDSDLFWSITEVALVTISLFLFGVLFNNRRYVALLQLSQKMRDGQCTHQPTTTKMQQQEHPEGIPCSGVSLASLHSKEHMTEKRKEKKKCLKVSFSLFFLVNFVSPCLAGGRSG